MPASTWSTTDKNANLTLSGSNLIATAGGSNAGGRGKDPKRAGKYYIEYTSTTTQGGSNGFGFAAAKAPFGTSSNVAASLYISASTGAIVLYDNFGVQIGGTGSLGASITTGTVLCAALDLDNARSWFRIGAAGNWNGNAANNPATGVGGTDISPAGLGRAFDAYPFTYLGTATNSITANFGGSAFTGTVPSGFTSGWDDSVTVLTNAVATQLAMEQWAPGLTNQAQLTQIAIEQWATAATGNTQALVTQVAMEQWASVQLAIAQQQAMVMILA